MDASDELLRYPIGKFTPVETYTPVEIHHFIQRIESLPGKVEATLKGLSAGQLNTPYRDGGWTILQVAHHLPDSHLNAYIRTKWALTEETPTIKAYDEKSWATTPETHADYKVSLDLLTALHHKWVILLKGVTPANLSRQFYHPDSKKHIRLDTLIATYAWHGDHHLAQIEGLKLRKGWV
jgi:hypothetical protein